MRQNESRLPELDGQETNVARYEPGDSVKVEFLDETAGIGEWMWICVIRCDDERQFVCGILDNEPVNDCKTKFGRGSELMVSYSKIREHRKPTEFTKQ
jgi:uncharacterized protein YegJ (DUF2314 family)